MFQSYTVKNVCDLNTERWMDCAMLKTFLSKEIEMNSLRGYRRLERQVVVNNSVCLIIGENLLKFR
jgi:hypothetical protein